MGKTPVNRWKPDRLAAMNSRVPPPPPQRSVLRAARKKAADVMYGAVGAIVALILVALIALAHAYAPGAAGTGGFVIFVAISAWQHRQKKKEEAKAKALADVQDAITVLAAVQGDDVRWARAKTTLHATIRNANNVGVLLDALPDDVVVSLDKLNQLENVIAAEHAAADRRAGIHKTAVWGMVALAFAVVLACLTPYLPFVQH